MKLLVPLEFFSVYLLLFYLFAILGIPPFKSSSVYNTATEAALDMIHNHLAKKPANPRIHLPEHLSNPVSPSTHHDQQKHLVVLQVLSDIILKLLTKTPEDRYQSAAGLKSDLEHCLHLLTGINTWTIGLCTSSITLVLPIPL
jgi:serine/threonine protein kinase